MRLAGAEFGRGEIKHAVLAGFALTMIFAAAFARGVSGAWLSSFPAAFLFYLPFALVAGFPSFLLSLILQKRIAKRQGCTTEFRILPQWLAISILFAFLFGFIFAAPGAVSRFGNLTRAGAGKMGAAVPLAFLAVGGAALLLYLAGVASLGGASFGALALLALGVAAQVNSIMAAFSMIPIPGFAGADVWRWSKALFTLLLVAGVGLYSAATYALPLL